MPKVVPAALIWIPEQQIYLVSEQGSAHRYPLPEDQEQRRAWLAACSTFSFQGQSGRLTLRKEARQRGEDHYWYAYHRQGSRLVKRYAGRTVDLTLERLETIALALSTTSRSRVLPAQRTESVPTRSASVAQIREDHQEPLLVPKLSLPQPHPSLIARARLLARLDAALEHRLTVLAAPAGFGKTTLVSQWVAHLQTLRPLLPVAWVSLEAEENDPLRFWRYVITACQVFQADLGAAALGLLPIHSTPRQFSQEAVLTALLNDLATLSRPAVLVLEDYHAINNAQIHEALTAFVDHLPPALHLVLITRQEPPLPLARLRGQNALVELHADDLRFSLEETYTFFQRTTSFQLTAATIERVARRTEGWIAGLHLLAFALHRQESEQQAERFLTTLTGEHRHLLAYFVTEVLSAQSEPLQLFLLQTSVLNSLTGSLCAAVTGRSDSEALLETIEQANVFLQALDSYGQWYRYHALFAEAMQHEARRRFGEGALWAWYRRASAWYEQQGMADEAIEMALHAQEFAHVATLLEQHLRPHHAYTNTREYHTLRRWLGSLPLEVLRLHPPLCLQMALFKLFPHKDRADYQPELVAEVEHLLQEAETVWQAEGNRSGLGQVLALRALLFSEQADGTRATHLARQALAYLTDNDQQWRASCLARMGIEELQGGRAREARQLFQQARAAFDAAGNALGTRATLLALGETCLLEGALRQAGAFYREVHASAGEDRSDSARALLGLARLSYEWNILETARQEAEEALDLGTRLGDETVHVQASLILAEIERAQGMDSLAQHRLQVLLAQVSTSSLSRGSLLSRQIQAAQARCQLSAGDLVEVERWFTTRPMSGEGMPRQYQEQADLLVARLLVARGQTREALQLLAHLRSEAQAGGRIRSEVESLILMALACGVAGHSSEAKSLLIEGLSLARAEDYQRLFLDEGADLVALLREVLPTIRGNALAPYARLLVYASVGSALDQDVQLINSPSRATLPLAPLSPQEQRVFHLLGAGYSNPEIAEALVVSLNTVKTQVRSIYQKLNVQNRKEARSLLRS